MTTSSQAQQPSSALSAHECWELAQKTSFARLAVIENGDIFITPINILAADEKIYFRTALGSKLLNLQMHQKVTVQFDHVDDASAYAVNILGNARLLTDPEEIEKISQHGLSSRITSDKPFFVEITPRKFTGRYFKLN